MKALNPAAVIEASAKKLSRFFRRLSGGDRETLLGDERGEAYSGEAVKILFAVVIGALLLTLIYSLIKNEVFTVVSQKIRDLFSYDGTP